MRKLVLERKEQPDKTAKVGIGEIGVMMTPPIDEEYWTYRVRLSDAQAIVGFPKFNQVGVGFAVEEDWNTNLPTWRSAEETYEHIKHNKGDDSITREACVAAIELVRQAAVEDEKRWVT